MTIATGMSSKIRIVDNFVNEIEKIHRTINPPSLLSFFSDGFKLTPDDRLSKFRLEYSPWINVLCEWFENPEIEWIHLVQGSQTAKTTFMMGAFLYVSQYVSGAVPCLWAMSIEEEVKIFISKRLKPFLGEHGEGNALKNWKQSAFRFNNSMVKIGYASTRQTLRSMPCRFIFCDETGMWKVSTDYPKKRTRSFKGQRKGIFGTTPPESATHHSWVDATSGNFYQWWLKCPHCGERQPLLFRNLKFSGKAEDGNWDMAEVEKSTHYECPHCSGKIYERDKLSLINTGVSVCVDPDTYERKDEKPSKTRTLQISSLYSIFTSWGEVAVMFLEAKAKGPEALRIFITDELAEVPKDIGEKIAENKLAKLIDYKRPPGLVTGYDLYTAGVDAQFLGELYWSVVGWKSGAFIGADVLDYGVCRWKTSENTAYFDELQDALSSYLSRLHLCAIDASFGKDAPLIYQFVAYAGKPFVALKEVPTLNVRIRFRNLEINPVTKLPFSYGARLLEVNSHLIKDNIAVAWDRQPGDPGAWTFHANTSKEYLTHLCNEHRIARKGKIIWEPRYEKAPQHWFSSVVYAAAGMEDRRFILQKRKAAESKTFTKPKKTDDARKKAWINTDKNWFKRR